MPHTSQTCGIKERNLPMMEENIFRAECKPLTLDDYLCYDVASRGNLTI